MKFIALVISVFVFNVVVANAQNTFPESGPAGVNTLNPAGHFQVKGDPWFDANARILLTNNSADYSQAAIPSLQDHHRL